MDLSGVCGEIFDIQRFSIHDGPGIRTTVFLKGCPLRCPWCSNPESQCALPQLLYSQSRCLKCGRCAASCPERALTLREDGVEIDGGRCVPCEECSRQCPSGAMRLVGRLATAAEVLAEVARDQVFYQHSRGGMTLSGGEPLAQPDFALALLEGARDLGVHSAVETAGLVEADTLERVLRRADLVLFDVKHMDAAVYNSALGDGHATILDNARRASRLGVEMIVRVPVIPGFNDQPHQVAAIAAFARSLSVPELHLLPYHGYGAVKYATLGRRYEMAATLPPALEQLDSLRREVARLGMVARVIGS
ncbi:MAG TPA: glycyl-radical enzyme activating protein [Terriglobia bacterium]|nr:glycyl-radical enzyme activating protein [Terriglobia bacterium]